MTVISKELFYERIDKHTKCNIIHSWQEDCLKANLNSDLLKGICTGTLKFFMPVYLVQLLLNYNKTKKKKILILKFLESEMRSIMYGFIMAFLLMGTLCTLRNIFGRIYYYNLLLVPGFVSGLSLLVESKENHILDTLIFFNSFVETILKKLNLSKTLQTLLFMGISSFIMTNFENRKDPFNVLYCWFYTPIRGKEESINSYYKCDHSLICQKFIWEGFYKYFGVGYALNILRSFLSRFKFIMKDPFLIFKMLFNLGNCRLGLFIGGYVGLYRAITCYFSRSKNIKPTSSSWLAGLIAGATYTIYPKLQLLVIGITTCLQLFYDYISQKMEISNHFWQRQLLYMMCHGYLLHNKFLYPDTCSSYYSNMIDACTNNVARNIYLSLVSTYFM